MSKTDRTLAVLEHLIATSRPPTHAELGRELGIARSTLSDLLAELRRLGYVQLLDRRYLPGPRLVAFVHRGAAREAALHGGILPTLERIAAQTRETAAYVIELAPTASAPARVVSVAQAQSPDPIRYVADIGEPYPLETTAAGRVFLAYAGADADPELLAIRTRGFAVITGTRGSTALASAVLDPSGAVAGVISVTGPTERMADAETRVWPVLHAALQELRADEDP